MVQSKLVEWAEYISLACNREEEMKSEFREEKTTARFTCCVAKTCKFFSLIRSHACHRMLNTERAPHTIMPAFAFRKVKLKEINPVLNSFCCVALGKTKKKHYETCCLTICKPVCACKTVKLVFAHLTNSCCVLVNNGIAFVRIRIVNLYFKCKFEQKSKWIDSEI